MLAQCWHNQDEFYSKAAVSPSNDGNIFASMHDQEIVAERVLLLLKASFSFGIMIDYLESTIY